MLEYTKMILEKLSFNKELFNKELKKANRFLNSTELTQLNNWVEKYFSNLLELQNEY